MLAAKSENAFLCVFIGSQTLLLCDWPSSASITAPLLERARWPCLSHNSHFFSPPFHTHPFHPPTPKLFNNGSQGCCQEARQEGRQGRRQEARQGQARDVQDLHLQGPEAGAPRHRHLVQGHVDPQLVHQRHLREGEEIG